MSLVQPRTAASKVTDSFWRRSPRSPVRMPKAPRRSPNRPSRPREPKSEKSGAAPDFSDLGSLGLDGLFGDLLGAFGIRTGDRGDLRQKLPVSFEESILGCTKDISYQRVDCCER